MMTETVTLHCEGDCFVAFLNWIVTKLFIALQSEQEDRNSDPSLEEKLQQTAKGINEEKRKSARRKE